ncbi:MAG: hypothetical protein L6R41_001853 [Letrouitia leprolyta]|nr:MAG: hypothetical protein L6R41_001853 [Letrouitia leprolyta]
MPDKWVRNGSEGTYKFWIPETLASEAAGNVNLSLFPFDFRSATADFLLVVSPCPRIPSTPSALNFMSYQKDLTSVPDRLLTHRLATSFDRPAGGFKGSMRSDAGVGEPIDNPTIHARKTLAMCGELRRVAMTTKLRFDQ